VQLLANALIAGSLAALIAGGLALVYGTLGVFNLALGQMVLIGGYATWWLHQSLGLPLLLSVLGGVGTGAVVSWLTFGIFVRPFYKLHRFLPLVTTIALSMLLDGVILLLFGTSPRSIITGSKTMVGIGSVLMSVEQIVLIALTIALLFSFAYVLHSTAFGRKIRAVVQHDYAAMSLGINALFLHRFVFIMSGVFAALGGIFIGIDTSLSPRSHSVSRSRRTPPSLPAAKETSGVRFCLRTSSRSSSSSSLASTGSGLSTCPPATSRRLRCFSSSPSSS